MKINLTFSEIKFKTLGVDFYEPKKKHAQGRAVLKNGTETKGSFTNSVC